MKNINARIEKCTWKKLVEAKGERTLSEKLDYCKNNCEGYDTTKHCYYVIFKGPRRAKDINLGDSF